MPHVERSLGGSERLGSLVRVPQFDRGVDVHHPAGATPFQQFDAVDVPRQVDQQIARLQMAFQFGLEILLRDPQFFEADPLLLVGGCSLRVETDKVHHGVVLRGDAEILQQQRQCALRDAAESNHHHPTVVIQLPHGHPAYFPAPRRESPQVPRSLRQPWSPTRAHSCSSTKQHAPSRDLPDRPIRSRIDFTP